MTTLTAIAPALANHLWQSTLFAAAVWLMTLLLRRNPAKLRHALWLAASLKFLVPFSILVSLGAMLPRPQHATAPGMVYAIDFAGQPFSQIEPIPVPAKAYVPTLQERLAARLTVALAVIWLCGAATVLLIWFARWRQVSAILRSATLATRGRELDILRRLESATGTTPRAGPIPLRLSPELMEPGIFGIVRPTLLWPEQLSARLDDCHIEAILAHELIHARRRDNLTAALHMFVEAIFWFHPFVWLIERRLIEERERACDEAVLHLGATPETYAEGLLKAVRFCVESPLACVAGISGADLKDRVVRIVTERVISKLDLSRKLLLFAAGIAAFTVPIVLGLINAPLRVQAASASAQMDDWVQAAGSTQQFDVASVRPSHSGKQSSNVPLGAGDVFTSNGGSLSAKNFTLLTYLEFAYKMADYQEEALKATLPEWVTTDKFNIEARTDTPNVTKDQLRLMMRSLLAERFHLAVHYETRQVPVFALLAVKGGVLGPKLRRHPAGLVCPGTLTKEAKTSPQDTAGGFPTVCGGILGLTASAQDRYSFGAANISLNLVARALSSWGNLGRPVIDRTNLPGTYDFVLDFTPDPRPTYATIDSGGPTFQQALHQQLGLKLEAQKGPVDFLVLDHIERPTPQDQTESTDRPALPIVAETSSQPKLLPVAQVTSAPIQKSPLVPAPVAPAPFVFEVSTVKLNNSGDSGSHTDMPGGLYTATNVLLKNLMQYSAYGIPEPRILGGPKWIDSQRFDIEAKIDTATFERLKALPRVQRKPATQAMFQQLLANRFKLAVHWETRELPVYNLVIANKSGPTLAAPEDPDHSGTSAGDGQLQATNATLPEIAQVLTQEAQRELGRVVIDKTGIAGRYDIRLKWTPDTDSSATPLSIFTAIQDQLGLKLEPAKGPVQVLVIDHVELPSEN